MLLDPLPVVPFIGGEVGQADIAEVDVRTVKPHKSRSRSATRGFLTGSCRSNLSTVTHLDELPNDEIPLRRCEGVLIAADNTLLGVGLVVQAVDDEELHSSQEEGAKGGTCRPAGVIREPAAPSPPPCFEGGRGEEVPGPTPVYPILLQALGEEGSSLNLATRRARSLSVRLSTVFLASRERRFIFRGSRGVKQAAQLQLGG